MFSCTSLSIFRTIIFNSLLGDPFLWGQLLEANCVPLVVSCFPDSSWSLEPCIGVCTFEEAVTSSRLYGLTSIRKDLHLWLEHAGARCDPRSSSGSGVEGQHQVLSTQATGVYSINNCVVLGECCGASTVAARAVGVLSSALRSRS